MKIIIQFYFDCKSLWLGASWNAEQCTLCFQPLPMLGMKIRIWGRRCYVLRKEGFFYRPKASGYTSNLSEAGFYTHREAKALVHYPAAYSKRFKGIRTEPSITMHHVQEFAAA